MTKPVPETMEVGSMGEAMTAVILQKIRWAPPSKISQDIGDDFITFARVTAEPGKNAIAYDRSAPVFLQVKASRNKYAAPAATIGKKAGWWYEETETDHFDHWIEFGLPYLLVLVDTSAQRAFWVEVRVPAIRSTGKGNKIFVPAANTLDEDCLDELNQIALSRRTNDLEGSAWSGRFDDLPLSDRLRYALVMPRLIAPHGNRPFSGDIGYEQAVAMLMRGRLSELAYRAREHKTCPEPKTWAKHRDWGWRFAAAVRELLQTGQSDSFATLESSARHGFERDVCRVIQACMSYVGAEPEVSFLKKGRNTRPADLGWMKAQAAAFLHETGKTDEASKAAQAAIFALRGLDGDLTVSAIRGGAAAVLYSIAGMGQGDLPTTITAQDNAASWWRASDIAHALQRDLDYRFTDWTRQDVSRMADTHPRAQLSNAAWNAAFAGNWGSWRQISRQIAQLTLTSSTALDDITGSIALLAYVGERDHAKQAALKTWREGPVEALLDVVTTIASLPWSKRIEGPALSVLAAAGDLLPPQLADATISRIVTTLKEDGDIRRFGGGFADRWAEIPKALAKILKAATIAGQEEAAQLALHNIDGHETRAHNVVAILGGLALVDLPPSTVDALVDGALARDDHYGLQMLEQLAEVNERAEGDLRQRARNGSAAAVRALLVNGSMERSDFAALGRNAAKSVAEMVQQAGGTPGLTMYTSTKDDRVHDLAVSAFRTQNNRLWKALTDALEARCLPQQQTQGAILVLAQNFDELPAHVQRKLKKLAPTLNKTPTAFGFGRTEFDAAVAKLGIAAGNVDKDELETFLLALRNVDPRGFVTTLDLWNSPGKLSFLTMMAFDSNAVVRAQAAYSLIVHAHKNPDDAARAYKVVKAVFAAETGCSVADAVAQGIAQYHPTELSDLDTLLQQHPSAIVRASLYRIADGPEGVSPRSRAR